jgi:glycosyltransferase involved in cell wall biosynthesis
MSELTFSIVLPIYKQEKQIFGLYETYVNALNKLEDNWELIFVVNGPSDKSLEMLQGLIGSNSNVKAFRIEGKGWGKAVKYGISKSQGKFVCYTNSARTKIEDLMLLLKYAKVNDKAVVKATRIVRESFLRRFGSVLYNFENRFLFKTPIWDVNGTPKILPKEVLNTFQIVSDGDLIDAEIMAKCFKKGIPIIEIPVVFTTRISGKSTTGLKSAYKMYTGLLKLRREI